MSGESKSIPDFAPKTAEIAPHTVAPYLLDSNRRDPLLLEELSPQSPLESIRHAQSLLRAYGRFVQAQPGTARFCRTTLEEEAASLPASYLGQGGGCLIAWSKMPPDDPPKPVGFVAWRALPAHVHPRAWEMKRLWVDPAARGLGAGKALIQEVLARAHRAARVAVLLDTAPDSMAAAHRLYLSLGFKICPPYNDNPVEGIVHLIHSLQSS